MHQRNIQAAGKAAGPDTKVLIMLHGRGGSAADILSLAAYLDVEDFALVAPEATGNTWYPYSFLAPPAQNEPWLSSALELLDELVTDLYQKGVEPENLYFLGFSQGACLTLEFVARNAERYGGVVAFTGGLIGDQVYAENYDGDFVNTPIFIGTSNPDPHVPLERVQATTSILKELGANVTEKVYPGMGHTISQDEIDWANKLVFNPEHKTAG
ncbi:alpha/beta hydrolase [Paracnuella aquatica]|uniref:alpha/beta hydrolase n=1 Tax=Paracnuella aquatica TaxID=2268757 RepID=UPI000DEF0623|nr:dienelactone hydrolase family protein [Paracnuella aquatica]RPD47338.1 phospholipase [Paracnuella aquatica]